METGVIVALLVWFFLGFTCGLYVIAWNKKFLRDSSASNYYRNFGFAERINANLKLGLGTNIVVWKIILTLMGSITAIKAFLLFIHSFSQKENRPLI